MKITENEFKTAIRFNSPAAIIYKFESEYRYNKKAKTLEIEKNYNWVIAAEMITIKEAKILIGVNENA